MFKIKTIREISDDDVADLLCAAFEGGIGYWATLIDEKVPEKLVDLSDDIFKENVWSYIHYPLSDGGSVTIKDIEGNGDEYIINRELIENGLQIMAKEQPAHFSDFLTEGQWDAITGDVFIQCCCFGKVIYG